MKAEKHKKVTKKWPLRNVKIIEIDHPAPKFSTYSLRNLKFFCDDPKRNEKSEFERVFAIGPFSLKSMY